MTIKDILLLKNGQRYSYLDLHVIVKKPKSKLETNGEWTQEVVLSDSTGEIQAEVLVQTYDGFVSSLGRGQKIEVSGAELQNGVDGLRLYVFNYFVQTAAEPEPYQPKEQHYTSAEIEQNKTVDWDKIAKGKTRCNIICAMISNGQIDVRNGNSNLNNTAKNNIENFIEYIFTGK
jgi:hypothetical protein